MVCGWCVFPRVFVWGGWVRARSHAVEDGLIGAFDLRGRGVVYDVCGGGEKGDAEPSGTSRKQGERGV